MAPIVNHEGSLKKVKEILNKGDRVSSLPDSLLVHILSFLPTKYAVGTSILSSRWKHLWASVPILDFDANMRFRPSFMSSSNFMNFIDRVLFNHELSCIQKFRLNCQAEIDISRIYTWIGVAIKRGVQELDINIRPPEFDIKIRDPEPEQNVDLPLSLFTCPTLMVLKLGNKVRFDVPYSAHFRSLKILHISFDYYVNGTVQNLFHNCPVLEDLFMEGIVSIYEEIKFDVYIPTLKSLKLSFVSHYDHVWECDGNDIVLNAPILEYLTLQDDCLPCYVLNNLTSLVKAYVNVGGCSIQFGATKQHADRVLLVLRETRSVKYLSLGSRTMGALDYAGDNSLPLFPNLIRLELHVHKCYGWIRLLDLLNNMPNLLYLVLEKSKKFRCAGDDASKEFKFVEQEVVPYCLLMHLQEIEINGFQGLRDELKLIEFFLRNSKVLRKIEINAVNLEEKQEREFLEKLLMFPSSSITCQILITRKENFAPASIHVSKHGGAHTHLRDLLPTRHL